MCEKQRCCVLRMSGLDGWTAFGLSACDEEGASSPGPAAQEGMVATRDSGKLATRRLTPRLVLVGITGGYSGAAHHCHRAGHARAEHLRRCIRAHASISITMGMRGGWTGAGLPMRPPPTLPWIAKLPTFEGSQLRVLVKGLPSRMALFTSAAGMGG